MMRDFLEGLAQTNQALYQRLEHGALLADYCTMKTGGPADLSLALDDEDELQVVLRLCQQTAYPYFFIGKGSNLIFSDAGYRGLLLRWSERFSELRLADVEEVQGLDSLEDNEVLIYASAAVSLVDLAKFAAEQSLTGLEFSCGIPGSLGGGLYMNAGAYDSCLEAVCEEVRILDEDLSLKQLLRDELKFSYRHSVFRDRPSVVLGAYFRLKKGDQTAIWAKMAELTEKREQSQPLEMPSSGSVFKRPPGHFAGKLIMEAGLQGTSVGDAEVSTKHAGFIVNKGQATTQAIIELIEQIRERIWTLNQVRMEPEVRVLDERGRPIQWRVSPNA